MVAPPSSWRRSQSRKASLSRVKSLLGRNRRRIVRRRFPPVRPSQRVLLSGPLLGVRQSTQLQHVLLNVLLNIRHPLGLLSIQRRQDQRNTQHRLIPLGGLRPRIQKSIALRQSPRKSPAQRSVRQNTQLPSPNIRQRSPTTRLRRPKMTRIRRTILIATTRSNTFART